MRKRWRPKTCEFNRYRDNEWTKTGRRDRWRDFKKTAGIDGRMTLPTAREKFKAKGIHKFTLLRWIFGHTDVKLSSAIDACEAWGCSLDGFAAAMREAWELAERKWLVSEAIDKAREDATE